MRYARKPITARWDVDLDMDVLTPETITVYESDPYEPTGLVDAEGVELYRVEDRVPMGIHRGNAR